MPLTTIQKPLTDEQLRNVMNARITPGTYVTTMTDDAKLTLAYSVLKKAYGFITRRNFWCCQNCAGTALGNNVKNHQVPCVFYTKQDGTVRRSRHNEYVFGPDGFLQADLYLCFGVVRNYELDQAAGYEPDENREQDRLVGGELVRVLKLVELPVEWDGSPMTRPVIRSTAAERQRAAEEARRQEREQARVKQDATAMLLQLNELTMELARRGKHYGITSDEAAQFDRDIRWLRDRLVAAVQDAGAIVED